MSSLLPLLSPREAGILNSWRIPRRWGRSRSRRASPVETPEPEEEAAEPMEADDEEQLPQNRAREASPAAAEADAEDEAAGEESPEPAARVGRRRSRSRQPAEPAAATQLPASQALTQRGGARPTQRTLSQIPRMNFPKVCCVHMFWWQNGVNSVNLRSKRLRSAKCQKLSMRPKQPTLYTEHVLCWLPHTEAPFCSCCT